MQIVNLLKYYTINHTLHQLCRHVNPFFSKNCLNNILKNNSTLIIGWKKCEQTDKCRIDIRKLVGDRSWRWLATLPKWRFCMSQWVVILYEGVILNFGLQLVFHCFICYASRSKQCVFSKKRKWRVFKIYFRNYLNPLCGWPDAFAHKSNQSSIKKAGIYICALFCAFSIKPLTTLCHHWSRM